MRAGLYILAIVFLVSFCGCAHVKVNRTFPDGSSVSAEYTRWFNQSIDGFGLKSPEGWELSFDRQESELETAFRLGALSVSIGGGGP